MLVRKTLTVLFVVLLSAGLAVADIKVVKETHQDGFTIMGQTQPPEDKQQATWIGKDMMYMDQGDSARHQSLSQDLPRARSSNRSHDTRPGRNAADAGDDAVRGDGDSD